METDSITYDWSSAGRAAERSPHETRQNAAIGLDRTKAWDGRAWMGRDILRPAVTLETGDGATITLTEFSDGRAPQERRLLHAKEGVEVS